MKINQDVIERLIGRLLASLVIVAFCGLILSIMWKGIENETLNLRRQEHKEAWLKSNCERVGYIGADLEPLFVCKDGQQYIIRDAPDPT